MNRVVRLRGRLTGGTAVLGGIVEAPPLCSGRVLREVHRFAELPEVGDGVGHVRQQVVQQGLGVLARIHAPFLRQARVHLFQNDIQPLDIRPLWGQAIISHTALPPL